MSAKTDIWMPLYIGDYLADTVMLNAEQSGCYLHWLMAYWRTGPLDDDLPALIQMGKLTSADAPSIAQALLKRFFAQNGDGRWHQKRMDAEKERWLSKKLKAKEKASKAASNRWCSKDATSNAPSIPQAMLERCPSPSPLPKEQILFTPSSAEADLANKKKKRSKKKSSLPTKTDIKDARHSIFKMAIWDYWKSKNSIDCPWGVPEGRTLDIWLSSCPNITIEQFREMLRNRYRSQVNHADRPSLWISRITSYANGPVHDRNAPKMSATLPPNPGASNQLNDADAYAMWQGMSEQFKKENPWRAQ